MENVFNQGRIIVDMDQDEGIELVADHEKDAEVEGRHADKQAELYNLDQDHSSKAVAASTPIPAAKPKILNITAALATPKVKDKGKGILIEAPKPMKKKDQIELDAEASVHKEISWNEKKPQTESEARKNMIFYLKNTKVKRGNGSRRSGDYQKYNETLAQKAAKRRKLSEEAQEAEDLRKRLEIVQDEDDDVFVEATPLAQMVPVMDYQIVVIDNKPRWTRCYMKKSKECSWFGIGEKIEAADFMWCSCHYSLNSLALPIG
nr:hypothetical protein [Tanacetum cinerariifolium]